MEIHLLELADLFADNHIANKIYQLSFQLIQKEQVRDTKLIDHAKKNLAYFINVFHGGRKSHQLICKNGRTVIPLLLQYHIVN